MQVRDAISRPRWTYLGEIQGCEGKADTTMELMLDRQKRLEEKLEALGQENSAIKAQLNNQDNKEEKDESSEDFEEEEESM